MSRAYLVSLSGHLGAVRQLDAFSDDVEHKRRRLPVHVDLSAVAFLRPVAVVGLALLIEEMVSRGRDVRLVFPHRPGTLNYLIGIGLPEVLEALGAWQWPEDFPKEASRGLRPVLRLARFSSSDDVERLSTQMEQTFETDSILPATLRFASYNVFSELADNVVNHSGSDGFVLAQRFEYREGLVIDITVGDRGMGFRRSLETNVQLRSQIADDESALRLAMIDGVTSVADPYRGYGLGHVKEELSAPGRWPVIRSGNVMAHWREGQEIEFSSCGATVGTLVHAVIPT